MFYESNLYKIGRDGYISVVNISPLSIEIGSMGSLGFKMYDGKILTENGWMHENDTEIRHDYLREPKLDLWHYPFESQFAVFGNWCYYVVGNSIMKEPLSNFIDSGNGYVEPLMVKNVSGDAVNITIRYMDKDWVYYLIESGNRDSSRPLLYRVSRDGSVGNFINFYNFEWYNLNFIGEYIYFDSGNISNSPKGSRALCRIKANGTGRPEDILYIGNGVDFLNSAGYYLYFRYPKNG